MTRPAPAGTSGSADAAPSAHVLLLFTVVVLSWGTSWLPIRYQIDEALPEVTLFWRFAGADVLLWGLVWWRGAQWRYPPGVHLRLVLMGCSMFGVNYLVMYNAAYDLPTGMLAVIFSTASLYGFAFDALFFGRRTGPRALAGVAVGFAGLTLVFLPQVTGTAFNAAMAHAFGLAIVATAMFATGSSFAAATQKRGVSVRGSAAWACLYGSIAMALIVVARGGDFSVPLKTTYLLSLGWHIVVATAIALSAYVALVGAVGMGRAAYTTVVFPVIALALSTWLEGLQWTAATVAGVVLIAIGNTLVLRRESPLKRIAPQA